MSGLCTQKAEFYSGLMIHKQMHPMYKIALHITRDPNEAEDVAQMFSWKQSNVRNNDRAGKHPKHGGVKTRSRAIDHTETKDKDKIMHLQRSILVAILCRNSPVKT